MWYNKIYETRMAEDLHISFSLMLFCDIKCKMKKISGLNYKSDDLSSSNINLSKTFYNDYTINTLKEINSSYIFFIKRKYNIY